MISLNRSKHNKWIMQKNINSSHLMKEYVEALSLDGNKIQYSDILTRLKKSSAYIGRSAAGSTNTMGVRFSQMCFYMFGYKKEKIFMPSPMTKSLIGGKKEMKKSFFINLFSMQYPSPYSNTPDNFELFSGRLITKLLLEERINYKLYIDEFIWFIPFIEKINQESYNDLIESIIEYRELTYEQKLSLFKSVKDYHDVFANTTHEMNYYFLRIFEGFGVFNIIPDKDHNKGKLFKFNHGNGNTIRNDAYSSGKKISGYVKLDTNLLESGIKLLEFYDFLDKPTTQSSDGVYSRSEWIVNLYDLEPLQYLSIINSEYSRENELLKIINNMTKMSKYGSKDGKDFENSLKPVFELFREVRNVDIISGSGDTDLLCAVSDDDTNNIFKINVDAKSSKKSTSSLNPARLTRHMEIHNSEYCIVVSPRFARGVKYDIENSNIVTITAESLANYCTKDCYSSEDGFADFDAINQIIYNNLGKDISIIVTNLTNDRHGIQTN